MKKLFEQIIKFGLVGFLCFFIDYGIMVFLTEIVNINYLISSGISFTVSVIVNYILSLTFVFDTKKGNKIKCYDINKCQFGARIVNSIGDSECELNIVDEDNKTDYIDCELIGYRQFNNLLNDLKVIGKESKTIKIKTIEKGDGN